MSTVKTLRAMFPGASWKEAFVRQVLRRIPELNPDAVDEAADSVYPISKSVKPELAAEAWVGELRGSADGAAVRSA